MITYLITKAQEIENNTDANLSGALMQVTKNLTVDECEEIFKDRFDDNAKKLARWMKKIDRVNSNTDPKWFNVSNLRNDVLGILEAVMRGR